MPESLEQQARDLLERIGVDDAQSFSAGDLVELANLLANRQPRRPGETPDFDQIARQFFIDYRGDPIVALSEQLRQVWNARGAVDLVTLEAELSSMIVTTTSRGTASFPYGETLARAIGKLDR